MFLSYPAFVIKQYNQIPRPRSYFQCEMNTFSWKILPRFRLLEAIKLKAVVVWQFLDILETEMENSFNSALADPRYT